MGGQPQVTLSNGSAGFPVPNPARIFPLGIVQIQFFFNGVIEFATHQLSSVFKLTVRFDTQLLIDPISGNSGRWLGGHHWYAAQRQWKRTSEQGGTPLSIGLNFNLDGSDDGFTLNSFSISPNGTWSVKMVLDADHPAGQPSR